MADLGPAGVKQLTRSSLLTIVPRLAIGGGLILLGVSATASYLLSDRKERVTQMVTKSAHDNLVERANTSVALSHEAYKLAQSSTEEELAIFSRVLASTPPNALPYPAPRDDPSDAIYRKDGTALPLGVPFGLITRDFLHNFVYPVEQLINSKDSRSA